MDTKELDEMVTSAMDSAIANSPEFNAGWRECTSDELVNEILDCIPYEYNEAAISESIERYRKDK